MLSDQNKALVDNLDWKIDDEREHCWTFEDTVLNRLLDAARQEGRQSSGERVKALEEGLKPFAQIADRYPTGGLQADIQQRSPDVVRRLHAAYFYHAAALLSPQAAPVEQGEEGDPEDFPDALKPSEIRHLAAENMKRMCRDDDDGFFLNGSAVGVTSGGGGSQVAECDDEGIAAVVCTALMDFYSGRTDQAIACLEVALTVETVGDMKACIQAALDFVTNDEEALAEGRLWAPANEQKDGAS